MGTVLAGFGGEFMVAGEWWICRFTGFVDK